MMTGLSLLLSQTDNSADTNTTLEVGQSTMGHMDILHHPDLLLDSLGRVPFIGAMTMVVLGLLCVFNGYRWHRWVIVILAFIVGLSLGQLLAESFGRSQIIAVALGFLCAIVATPMQKVAVALFGGLTGAFIGANIWTALNAESANLHWAGAAMGFIALALASLIVFRLVIVLFTSVGGAAMIVFGVITLLLQVDGWEPAIRDSLLNHTQLMPMLVLLAAVGSFVLQEGRSRAAVEEQE